MKTSQFVPAIVCIGVLIPVVLFARSVEPLLRECMRDAVDTYHTALVDSQRTYDDELEQAMEERKAGYIDSWSREDDKDQRNVQRDADKRYSNRISEIRKFQRDRDKESGKTYSDAKRVCGQEASSRSSASRDSSRSASLSSKSSSSTSSSRSSSSSRTSSSRSSSSSSGQACGNNTMCGPGTHCACTSACGPNAEICTMQCVWKCVPNNPPPPPPPPYCEPYICSDGRVFPTCTANGGIIDYFRNPCEPLPPYCEPIVCSDGRQFPRCTPNGGILDYAYHPCQPQY